jgi:DNA-directed RNA polymerase subunit RPC12/RpoP
MEIIWYQCPDCAKSYKSPQALYTHSKMHNGSAVKCEYCDKIFPTQYKLDHHYDVHAGEDVFTVECGFMGCGKKFKDDGDGW